MESLGLFPNLIVRSGEEDAAVGIGQEGGVLKIRMMLPKVWRNRISPVGEQREMVWPIGQDALGKTMDSLRRKIHFLGGVSWVVVVGLMLVPANGRLGLGVSEGDKRTGVECRRRESDSYPAARQSPRRRGLAFAAATAIENGQRWAVGSSREGVAEAGRACGDSVWRFPGLFFLFVTSLLSYFWAHDEASWSRDDGRGRDG